MKLSAIRQNIKEEQKANSIYFRFEDGLNTLRFVSEILPIFKSFENGKAKVYLTEAGAAKDTSKDGPRRRFLVWAIDRKTNTIKQVEFGGSVMDQIFDIAGTPGYEFDETPNYDFHITKTGENLDTNYAVVGARSDTPITEDEKQKILGLEPLIESVKKDAVDLKEIDPNQPPF